MSITPNQTQPDSSKRHGQLLLQGFDSPIACLAAHPFHSCLATISACGVANVLDYDTKHILATRLLGAEDRPLCVAFSPDGCYIAAGFSNGLLRLLRWGGKKDLAEVACFQVKPGTAYTMLQFSQDSVFLAAADGDHCLALFRFVAQDVHLVAPAAGGDAGGGAGRSGSGASEGAEEGAYIVDSMAVS